LVGAKDEDEATALYNDILGTKPVIS